MQIVINIPEYVIDDMKECGFIPEEDNEELCKAIDNGTPIPDNATNGDVMKAIFNCKTSNEDSDYLVKYSLDGIYEEVNSNWWNAPYQKGGK